MDGLERFIAEPIPVDSPGRFVAEDEPSVWLVDPMRIIGPALSQSDWGSALTSSGLAPWSDYGAVLKLDSVSDADRARFRRPTAFLDRDGVINIDHGYTYRTEDLAFTPTAIEGVRAFNRAGHRVIVVTNQAGVARGYYSLADVDRFHEAMQDRMLAGGAHVDAFYSSPYHPEGTVEQFRQHHPDRKPGPGMILRAMQEWSVDKDRSVLIGDKDSDMEAAGRAGIRGVLVPSNTCDLLSVAHRILDIDDVRSPAPE